MAPALAFDEALEWLLWLRPIGEDLVDVAGPGWPRSTAFQRLQQFLATRARPLGNHQDPAVSLVGRISGQTLLQRPAARPPAKTDSLHPPVHPGGEPDVRLRHRRPGT